MNNDTVTKDDGGYDGAKRVWLVRRDFAQVSNLAPCENVLETSFKPKTNPTQDDIVAMHANLGARQGFHHSAFQVVADAELFAMFDEILKSRVSTTPSTFCTIYQNSLVHHRRADVEVLHVRVVYV